MSTPRILIVEDSIVSAMMYQATINRKQPDFEVRVRKSLAGGIEELLNFAPDLVLLDASLPDSPDGEETIKALPKFCEHACVIVVSGHPDLREAALAAGANDFMAKGVGEDPATFIERINKLIPQCVS